MFQTILIGWLSAWGVPAAPPAHTLVPHASNAPYVELWADRDEVYRRGDRVKVYFRTDIDAYVTLFRVDTDGRVRVLFPIDPWEDNYARGGISYQVDARDGGHTFRVDDYPGQGYLFAIASADPFQYSRYVRGDHWDYRAIAEGGRVVGDPYVALGDLIDGIVPANYVAYSYDVAPYYVEEHYEYPRFLCYDCHTYASWPSWDPYGHSCIRFRIVIYDDPYYYPARAYSGTRVVYRRPVAIVPRYIFRDRTPNDRYVVTMRERPVDAVGQRRIEPGATRSTVGTGVRVPAPIARDATRPATDPGRRLAPQLPNRPTQPTRKAPQLERRDPTRRTTPAQPPRRADPTTPTRRTVPQRTPAQAPPVRRTGPSQTPPTRTQPQRSPTRRRKDPVERRN